MTGGKEQIVQQLELIATNLQERGETTAGRLLEVALQFLDSPIDGSEVPIKPGTLRARYRDYIRQLGPGIAGRLDLDPGDLLERERGRLLQAALEERVKLCIKGRNRIVVFWRELDE